MPDRVREAAGDALEIGKDPVAPFAAQPRERVGEKVIIVHDPPRTHRGIKRLSRGKSNRLPDQLNGRSVYAR